MRDLCHLRTHHECGCATGTCHQQRQSAPTIAAHRGDFIRFFSFAFVIAIVAFWALSEADKQFKHQQLEAQESSHVTR